MGLVLSVVFMENMIYLGNSKWFFMFGILDVFCFVEGDIFFLMFNYIWILKRVGLLDVFYIGIKKLENLKFMCGK